MQASHATASSPCWPLLDPRVHLIDLLADHRKKTGVLLWRTARDSHICHCGGTEWRGQCSEVQLCLEGLLQCVLASGGPGRYDESIRGQRIAGRLWFGAGAAGSTRRKYGIPALA